MRKITLFKRAFWIAGLTALTVLFLTCEDGFQFEKLWNDADKVAVSFTVDNAARTVLPQVSLNDVARYTLLGGINGAEEKVLKEFTGNGTSVSLDPGTWNFTLNAYNANGAHILQGKVQDKQINLSEKNQVSFSMSTLKSGMGAIQVTFSFPETASITQIIVKGDGSPENFTPESGGTFVYAKEEVAAGDYFINFEFYRRDTLQVVISELVLVRNGLTSVKTITLVGEDLKPILTGTVSISGISQVGKVLTASTDLLDGVGTINYQWNRDAAAIAGAVGSTYVTKFADIGSIITVTVTRTGYLGSITSEPTAVEAPITLTANTWTDGNLPTSSDEQWFKFTATTDKQYIHVSFGTLTDLYVQMYDSSGTQVGSETSLYSRSNGSTRYVSRTVTVGHEYYIRVRPYSSSYSGTYQIAFNTTFYPPSVTQLAANTWTDGNLPTSSDVQWFKFTATADTQYIHVGFGTLTALYVQLYNSSGATVGSETSLSSSTRFISRTVTVGQEYYIRVRPLASSYSGTYKIAFNTTFYSPGTTSQLTVNTWADGNLPTSSDYQWFKFTATADTQYIHVGFGTLTVLYVQVYDSSGATVGSETSLNPLTSSTRYVTQTLTSGQEYYIRVRTSSSSENVTYKIAFNTTFYPPSVIQLTANTWKDGNLPTPSDYQWFKFTATADTQYIHVSFDTLTALYVQLYDSSGTTVGSDTNLTNSNLTSNIKYVSSPVTVGQEYYIRVRTYNSLSGTYKIAFNTAFYLPGTTITQLTANTWTDGNLPTSSDEQWFKFTATADTQYIHASFGTLTALYVQLYDSSGATVGSQTYLSSSTRYVSQTVTVGQEYYIRVRPLGSSYSGTYKIAFNTTFYPPGTTTQLTVNTWADGNLPTSSDYQWFKFTATADTQYIHASFDTLTALYVQMYDSSSATLGSESSLYGSTKYISRTVTVGQEYYIRVRPYLSSYSGTYKIAFNTTISPPDTSVTLNSVAQNGSSSQNTTQLTLTFSQAISGLSASDITLSGVTGVTKGTLSSSGATYTLPISGFTAGGTLSVAVAKSGYTINGSPKDVTIYYLIPVTLNSVAQNGSSTQTTTQLTLTFNKAISDISASDITLSGVTGVTKGTLSGSGPTYTLPISGFTAGGTLSVAVAKSGYTINGSPKDVTIYYAIPVTLNSVTQNGSSSQTTTQLTLTFSQVISGLSASDITISGVTGVTKGTLSGSGPTYTLPISGFTAGGTLNVAVAKSGYSINDSPKDVTIYYAIPVTLNSVTQNGSVTQTTTQLTLTFNQAISGLSASDITISGVTGVSKGTLSGSGPTYTLPISGFTAGGTLSVAVAKSGYTINGSPKTVTIYYAIPATQLTANTWANGNLPTSSDEQWFKFTATASTQYIHANFGTLTDLYVQMYDSSGATVGSETNLYGSTISISRTVTVGQEYYIRVRPYGSNSGTYQIAFNTSLTAPSITLPSTAIQLTANTWANGNLPTSSDEQWFKFTATASTQYIHANFGTLNLQVYDSNGVSVGNNTRPVSLTVTSGQVYYIKVRSYTHSGPYKIAFNTTFYPPEVISLRGSNWAGKDPWVNGELSTSSDEQWFKFTATANPEYIHVAFGTLNNLYVQLYNSSGATVGSETNLYGNTKYISQTVTNGQVYYIKVRPYGSNSGTYQIASKNSSTPPSFTATLLTANTWADGNIPTSSGEQWFKFTATTDHHQYMHISFGTLNDLLVEVYNSSLAPLSGGEINLSSSNGKKYISCGLYSEEVYYIKVCPYSGSGTYKIAFNESTTPPN